MNTKSFLPLLYLGALPFSACAQQAEAPSMPSDSTTNAASIAETTTPAKAKKDTLTFALTGDIMLGTNYPSQMIPEEDAKYVLKDVKDLLVNADVALGNLEGAMTDGGKCTKGNGKNSFAFRMPTRLGIRLQEAGYDYLGIANNHSNDFGPVGIDDTEKTLASLGIATSGYKGHPEYAIIERGGLRIACMAFGQNSYNLKHVDTALVRQVILKAKKENVDLMVVSMHGGAEGRTKNHLPRHGHEIFLNEDRGALREFAHLCIDLGVDVVYGHGPHVTRCVEVYKGRFIAYSLGNFATPYGMSLAGISGYAPVVTIRTDKEGKFIDGQIHSFVQIKGEGPRKVEGDIVAKEMRNLTLSDIDNPCFTISETGEIRLKP